MNYRPIRAVWELTNACNARCIHCGSKSGIQRANELTEEEALTVCDQLKELGCLDVTMMGGEFFLSPYWEKVCLRLIELGIKVGPLTNGLLLNEKNIQKLKNLGVPAVYISIDGLPETHDYLRGVPGLFDKLAAHIKLAQAAGLQIGAISAMSGVNIHQFDALHDLLTDLGIFIWQVQLVENVGNAMDNLNLQLSLEQVYHLAKKISRYRRTSTMKVVTADNIGYYCSFEPLMRDQPFTGCAGGRYAIGIHANGDVRGCLSVMCTEKAIEGNLRERSLREIWEDPCLFSMYRQRTVEALTGFCAECEFREFCRGGCTAMAFTMAGKHTENPMCLHKYEVETNTEIKSEEELA